MSQLNLFPEHIYSVDNLDSKQCSKCGNHLPVSSYSLANGGKYRRSECRSCASKLSKVRDELRDTVEPPSDSHRCPICQRNADAAKGAGGKSHSTSWVLDHNHETETARGWLCHTCNRALGAFSDDVERLERAISYLTYYSEGLNVEEEDHLQRFQ